MFTFLKSNASTLGNPDELALVVVGEHNNVDVEDDVGTEDDIQVNADSDNVSDHHDKSTSVEIIEELFQICNVSGEVKWFGNSTR